VDAKKRPGNKFLDGVRVLTIQFVIRDPRDSAEL
jgi:hypothetical protein